MCSFIFLTENTMQVISESEKWTLILSSISLLLVVIGGIFAAIKWSQSLKYRRSEIVKPLIDNVRSNEKIAMVMNAVDWGKAFYYDGEFHLKDDSLENPFHEYSEEEIFNIIDETLSVFSYICYLLKIGSLKKKDMYLFEYEIRRLFDNVEICNYLFSLFHWSNSLYVHMSFCYLIKYALKNKYLEKSFLSLESSDYVCHLNIPSNPENKKRKLYL